MLNYLFVYRGVGAMEIVAMDMKVSGMYIARQLSFSGVSFRIEEIGLDGDFKEVYNKAAKLVRKFSDSVCCIYMFLSYLRKLTKIKTENSRLESVSSGPRR